MLQKAFVIGICFMAFIGCGEQISQEQKQSELEVSTQRIQQESEWLEQERIKLAETKERETRRQVIISSIKQLEQQMDLSSQRMLGIQQKISNLELQQNQLETEIRTHHGKVESFMMAHKVAIACMGAVGVGLDEKNQYSKDAKDIAGAVTVACGIGFLSNNEFRKEIFFVIDQLTQADSYAKNLMGQIKAIQSQIYTENESLEKEKSEASRLASDIQKYQSQLEI
jgi:chromosome segregation ATPase